MNVCVAGLWHLGSVTAACLAAAGHNVVGYDANRSVIEDLSAGKPPILEPGLSESVSAGLASGRLRFSADAKSAVSGADIVWITYDTPVDDEDRADVAAVVREVTKLFPDLSNRALVLVSSQVPVGTTRRLEQQFAAEARGRTVSFAYSPENLRLGSAIAVFSSPDRVVVGVRNDDDRSKVAQLLQPLTDRIEWMSVESAELTKHALNAFLATSVTFINEIAAIAERVGADAGEVERGLKTEARIGPKAYLSPGGAFAGGTLARDVMFLSELGRETGVPTQLLSSVKASNDLHRGWAFRRAAQLLDGVAGRTIGIWGLTYKPGTDTLRRSSAIELCRQLLDAGATVRVHDPSAPTLPRELADRLTVAPSAIAAAEGASALVVATQWPDYRGVTADQVVLVMARPLILDANRFTQSTLGSDARVEFVSVGKGRRS